MAVPFCYSKAFNPFERPSWFTISLLKSKKVLISSVIGISISADLGIWGHRTSSLCLAYIPITGILKFDKSKSELLHTISLSWLTATFCAMMAGGGLFGRTGFGLT